MTAIFAFLRPYLGYIALAGAFYGWLLWHDHQEIVKGESRVVAAQKAADVKEAAHVAKVEANADSTIKDLNAKLDAAALSPVAKPGVVVRMCVGASVPPHAGSADRPAGSGGDGPAGPSGPVGGDDIAAPTERILAEDRAIIQYLQGYIETCQTAGLCKK
ncbi:MAG: hypothetical protein ACHQ9S_18905 [Candidatus Binatia bacterium]